MIASQTLINKGILRGLIPASSVRIPHRKEPTMSKKSIVNLDPGDPSCLALRPKAAAKVIGIGQRQLGQLTRAGEIPHVRLGQAVLYPVNALREWLIRRVSRSSAMTIGSTPPAAIGQSASTTPPDLIRDHDRHCPRLGLRPREAAQALGISERLLWSLTNAGVVPHVRLGRAVVYVVEVLSQWLSELALKKGGRQ